MVHRESEENLPSKLHDEEEHRKKVDIYACGRRSFLLEDESEKNSEEIQEKVRKGGREKGLLS